MKLLLATKLTGKLILSVLISSMLVSFQGLFSFVDASSAKQTELNTASDTSLISSAISQPVDQTNNAEVPSKNNSLLSNTAAAFQLSSYAFGNPAGCAVTDPGYLSKDEMLASVQLDLNNSINFSERRINYIWNAAQNAMLDISNDPYVFEFAVDEFKPPLTYKGDTVATTFMEHGFVVWFRSYNGQFRLTVVSMLPGVYDSSWGEYVKAYWEKNGMPADEHIQPVMKKLPCHWVVDQGWVTNETLLSMFDLNWNMPDYLTAGRKFLAATCEEANRISQQEIGYWDAYSMCGPLAWRITKDANSFPYRIGNWYSSANLFTLANPRINGRPWLGFDPETYDLISVTDPMMGYDFEGRGNLQPGDIVYSYATLYVAKDGRYDHIFLVAGLGENNSRLSISNMVQNYPYQDCSIREIALYTPGDRENGVINHEWNDFGFGRTGTTGFDVLRWKWATYHLEGKPIQYTVRPGDTVETIAFDWKVSPQFILDANQITMDITLTPGQILNLPAPLPLQ